MTHTGTGALITQRNLDPAVRAIRANHAFHNSGHSLSGHPGPHSGWGKLPQEYRSMAWQADYVICSYSTPIAWRGSDGQWCMPPVRYSVTTSKHQSLVRQILATLDAEVSSV